MKDLKRKFTDIFEKIGLVLTAVILLFLAFLFFIFTITSKSFFSGLICAAFVVLFVISIVKLKTAKHTQMPADAQNTKTQRTLKNGFDYLSDKNVTPEMIYALKCQYSKKADLIGSAYFPHDLGSLSFKRRFDSYKVCIITTERPNFSRIKLGETLVLLPEPNNVYDKNAVVILSKNQKIGYLYRNGFQEIINEKFYEGYVVVGSVVEKIAKEEHLKIDVALYK